MPSTALGLLAVGFVLGLRHALDVDHLAAVSTLVSQRRSLWSSSLVGAIWGLGHTASLLAVGVLVIGLHTAIPPAVAHALELGVAVMLIGLGANLLRTVLRGDTIHHHAHTHDGHHHVHPHVHPVGTGADVGHHHVRGAGRRPFLVGLMHGLAGSAGLMLVVLATIPSPALAVAYLVVFGVGSIGGMMAMSALLGVPLLLANERFARAETVVQSTAALGSITVGVLLAWQMGATLLS